MCHCMLRSFWSAMQNCSCNGRMWLSKHTHAVIIGSNLSAIAHNDCQVRKVAMSMGLWTVCTPMLHCLRQERIHTTTHKKRQLSMTLCQNQSADFSVFWSIKRKSNLRKSNVTASMTLLWSAEFLPRSPPNWNIFAPFLDSKLKGR